MLKKLFSLLFLLLIRVHGDFKSDGKIVWGEDHTKISEDGNLLQLSLDEHTGSGFEFKDVYLFGKFDIQMKLVPRDSAGTVATFYLTSHGAKHDEIDIEFLGNVSGEPYTLHTNIYTQGEAEREQQFFLWFDPTEDFHTYSILWNPDLILFYVDGTPVRVYKNFKQKGVLYPKDQPMQLYLTIWNATWVTRGGRVQTDWSHAPFTASYRLYEADACLWSNGQSSCPISNTSWRDQVLDTDEEKKIKWIQKNYMIYNYCTDVKRQFPKGQPPECLLTF